MKRECTNFLALILLVLSGLVVGCSGSGGPTKVIGEGVNEEFLRIELEPPFDTVFASCRQRAGGNGIDLFLVDDKSLVRGDLVPSKIESGKLLVDLDWSLFGTGKKEVWLDGIDRLGEWSLDSLEDE